MSLSHLLTVCVRESSSSLPIFIVNLDRVKIFAHRLQINSCFQTDTLNIE